MMLNKHVTTVAQRASGVQVTLRDGSSYVGDILVGADGVHSTVRKEMWRIAESTRPGYIPESEMTGKWLRRTPNSGALLTSSSCGHRV